MEGDKSRRDLAECQLWACEGGTTHLDVLPDVGLGIDDAHVELVRAAIDEHSIVHLEECMLRVVLSQIIRIHSGGGKVTHGRVETGDGRFDERDHEDLLVVR